MSDNTNDNQQSSGESAPPQSPPPTIHVPATVTYQGKSANETPKIRVPDRAQYNCFSEGDYEAE